MIAEALYKKILNRLKLTSEQRVELSNRLNPADVCAGPFIKGAKMCPNTTALNVKYKFDARADKNYIKNLFKQNRINQFDLWLFYLFFDLPAMFSKKFLEGKVNNFKEIAGN